mmetsp:Transcript_43492/g.51201  ORF Transcript_43492/g.51201 Transcript_43492/m.51201 type:complete len:113 (+) Transcript_43492:858-1196(+)
MNANSIKYVAIDYTLLGKEVKNHIRTNYNVSEIPHIYLKNKSFGNGEVLLKYIIEGTIENVLSEGCRKISHKRQTQKAYQQQRHHVIHKGHSTRARMRILKHACEHHKGVRL